MKHLRTDWAGIQDIRQWLLNELEGLESTIIDGEYDDAESHVTDLVDRVRQMCGIDKNAEDMPAGSSILEDELVFMVRSKDLIAADTVRYWATRAEEKGSDPAHIARYRRWADEMEQYAAEHFAGQQHAPNAPELLP